MAVFSALNQPSVTVPLSLVFFRQLCFTSYCKWVSWWMRVSPQCCFSCSPVHCVEVKFWLLLLEALQGLEPLSLPRANPLARRAKRRKKRRTKKVITNFPQKQILSFILIWGTDLELECIGFGHWAWIIIVQWSCNVEFSLASICTTIRIPVPVVWCLYCLSYSY